VCSEHRVLHRQHEPVSVLINNSLGVHLLVKKQEGNFFGLRVQLPPVTLLV